MTLAGLGAAVPRVIRTTDVAEVAFYQAVAEEAIRIKAKAKGAL